MYELSIKWACVIDYSLYLLYLLTTVKKIAKYIQFLSHRPPTWTAISHIYYGEKLGLLC